MSCECRDGYFLTYNYGGWIICAACPLGQVGDVDDDHYSVISILILFKVKKYLKEMSTDEKMHTIFPSLVSSIDYILFWCSILTTLDLFACLVD